MTRELLTLHLAHCFPVSSVEMSNSSMCWSQILTHWNLSRKATVPQQQRFPTTASHNAKPCGCWSLKGNRVFVRSLISRTLGDLGRSRFQVFNLTWPNRWTREDSPSSQRTGKTATALTTRMPWNNPPLGSDTLQDHFDCPKNRPATGRSWCFVEMSKPSVRWSQILTHWSLSQKVTVSQQQRFPTTASQTVRLLEQGFKFSIWLGRSLDPKHSPRCKFTTDRKNCDFSDDLDASKQPIKKPLISSDFVARIPCSALKIGKNGCRSSHMDTPFTTNIFIAFTNVKLHLLLNEICPPTEVSSCHFWGGILLTENAVGCFSFFRCLHCWMKSSIHHQAPKTLQFQSLRSNAWQKSRCLMLMLSQRKTPERVFFFYKKMNASQSLENMRNLTLRTKTFEPQVPISTAPTSRRPMMYLYKNKEHSFLLVLFCACFCKNYSLHKIPYVC